MITREEFERLLDEYAKALEDAVERVPQLRDSECVAVFQKMNEARQALIKAVFP